MKAVVKIDHKLTNQIRTWGQPAYGFWNFVAGQSIAIYVLVAALFAYFGYLALGFYLIVFLSSYVIAILLQHFIRRPRPNFEKLTGYKLWVETYSCPSAHATVSAAAAASLGLLTTFPSSGLAIITIVCSIGFAFLIGVSRIIVGVHYLGDVMFGWMLGCVIASGYLMVLN